MPTSDTCTLQSSKSKQCGAEHSMSTKRQRTMRTPPLTEVWQAGQVPCNDHVKQAAG